MSQIFGIFRNRNIAKITVHFFSLYYYCCALCLMVMVRGIHALRRPRNIHRASLGIT